MSARRPLVELLYFDGCPNHEAARELVERISSALALEPDLRLIEVADEDAAQRQRFLGSPTVRVDGRDVDPEAEGRRDYGLSCRVYRTERGLAGLPDERWLRDALRRENPRGTRSRPRTGDSSCHTRWSSRGDTRVDPGPALAGGASDPGSLPGGLA